MGKAKFLASLSCLVLFGGCVALSGEQDLHERQEGNGTQEDANGAGDAASPEDVKSEDAPRSDARPADVSLADTRNDVAPDTSAPDTSNDGGSMDEDAPMEAQPPKCPDGTIDCGASGCINNDVHNCGRCGHDCTVLANVSGQVTCVDGACHFDGTACAHGFAICSTNPDDGCNTDITKTEHCGGCSTSCDPDGGTPLCAPVGDAGTAYACSSGCPAGFSLCTGSCVNEENDSAHCGSCTNACPAVTAGTATCTGGTTCGVTCNANTHACAGAAGTACVSDTDPNNCGTACATNCPDPTAGGGSAKCNGNTCTFNCPPGEIPCGNACVNVMGSDNLNCGGCGVPCSSGGKTCQSGSCLCPATTHDCSGTCSNNASVSSCGSSCSACAALANATVGCNGTSCTIASCNTNFANCNGTVADGCEVNTQTSASDCGTCGHACSVGGVCNSGTCGCPTNTHDCSGTCSSNSSVSSCGTSCSACSALANATAGCNGTSCTVASCNPNFANCNGTVADGCEVNTQTDSSNCGTCGHVCTGGMTCQSGSCQCPSPQVSCNGTCVNLASNATNCGACGHSCLYGSCSSSQCLAWSVATTSGGVNGLASDGVNVVWIDTASKNILEKPVSGSGNPLSLAQPSVQPSFVGMANGVVAFVTTNSSSTLSIWTATEGSINSGFEIGSFGDASTFPAAYSFAIGPSGNAAYTMLSAVATGATNIEKCTLGLTATCTNLAPAVIADVGGNGMVVNATYAFWTDFSGGNVSRTTLTSPTTTNVATGQSDPYVVAIDSTYVYFANLGANAFQIARALQVNPVPASPGSVLGNTAGTLNSLATDGKYVYYGGLAGTTKVGYVPVAGTAGQPLYNVGPSGSVPANALAAAGGAVYFYDSGDKTIRGIAAPP